jgi:glycine amidinotransferase
MNHQSQVGHHTGITRNPVVNAHNGWAPLEEIIVGAPFHLDYANDLSFRLFFHDNLADQPAYESRWPGARPVFDHPSPDNRLHDELLEDLEGFISILHEAGVTVRRPEILTEAKAIATPDWSSVMGHAMMPRDLFIVIGNEIIETAPIVRARYFESHLYKELFTEYFLAGAKWTMAPRSRLLDRNFDYGYVLKHGYTGPVPDRQFFEIMFDGAQILRFGRDLLFNCATENHRLGLLWLQRHLGSEYRVHEVRISDHHIDGLILPLRPGVLLLHEGLRVRELPAFLHTWDIIRYSPLSLEYVDEEGRPLLASQSIGMNVLSLDEQHVVVQDIQLPLIQQLEQAGFTPVPCRWRHGRVVGGGFHCMTLDIRRRGSLEDYAGHV